MADDAWQSAWVEVLPDFSEFSSTATPQIKKHLSAAGDAGGQAGAQRFGASFSGGIRGMGGLIAGAVASLGIGYLIGNAIRDGIDWVSDGITLASDLSESVNAVTVSYGEAGAAILELGENSADTMALTRAELNSAAVQFSNFSKTIAGSGGDAAATFETIAKRGVDFASVLNLEVADALILFQSGLAGETEPLRRYGIDMSAATVQAFALANGIGEGRKELTEAEKVQARYGLLMQQTDQYAGDFANTSDGLANSQRRLNASLAEVQTSAGEIFLPLMTELANLANDELVPALSAVVEESGPELAAALAESVPSLVEFLEAVIPLLPQLIELGITALPLLIRGGEALLPVLSFLIDYTTGWWTLLEGLFGLLTGDTSVAEFTSTMLTAGGVLGWLAETAYATGVGFALFIDSIVAGATRARDWVLGKFSEIVAFIQSIPVRVLDAIGDIGALLFSSGQALIGGFIDGITSMLKPAGDAVSGVLEWVMGFFPNSPADRGPLSGSGWNDLARSGEAVMTQFSSGFARAEFTGRLAPVLATVAPAVRSEYATSSAAATQAGGFNNYGTIQVTDERALVEYVETKKRRAMAGVDL